MPVLVLGHRQNNRTVFLWLPLHVNACHMLQILSFLETPDKEEPDPFPGVPRWQITVSGLHLLCVGWWEGIVSYEGNTLNFAGLKII